MRREALIGRALFEAAGDELTRERIFSELSDMLEFFEESPEAPALLRSCTSLKSETLALLDRLFKPFVHLFLLNSLKILFSEKTNNSFEAFSASYFKSYEKAAGILRVDVYSAAALNEGEKARLEEKISAETGKKPVFAFHIDEGLVGGLCYEYDNKRFDDTVLAKFSSMRDKIRKG